MALMSPLVFLPFKQCSNCISLAHCLGVDFQTARRVIQFPCQILKKKNILLSASIHVLF